MVDMVDLQQQSLPTWTASSGRWPRQVVRWPTLGLTSGWQGTGPMCSRSAELLACKSMASPWTRPGQGARTCSTLACSSQSWARGVGSLPRTLFLILGIPPNSSVTMNSGGAPNRLAAGTPQARRKRTPKAPPEKARFRVFFPRLLQNHRRRKHAAGTPNRGAAGTPKAPPNPLPFLTLGVA